MKYLIFTIMLFILVLCIACASSVVSPTRWIFQEEGIILRISADKKLHSESGEPKPLNLVIYQLKSIKEFHRISEEKSGLYKLLKCKEFDHSVAAVKKIKVLPGSETILRIDRVEEARYVGVVAGYNAMEKEKMVRVYGVPVYVKKEKMFAGTRSIRPGVLNKRIVFGEESIGKKITVAVKETNREYR